MVPKLMIEGGTEREKGTQFGSQFYDPHGFDIAPPTNLSSSSLRFSGRLQCKV